MTKRAERNAHLDRLALGTDCHQCGRYSDQPCKTPSGADTFPHRKRIDRAVAQYLKK